MATIDKRPPWEALREQLDLVQAAGFIPTQWSTQPRPNGEEMNIRLIRPADERRTH